jgi:DNA-binding response OmpR family regulator
MPNTTPTRISLIVEDDPDLQEAMAQHFGTAGFEVLSAIDYDGALRHLTSARPTIACIDIGLPSQSGYSLCEHIRARPELSRMPIIVTSERGFPEDMAHAEEAGANAFLKKPFRLPRLLEYVAILLDGPKGTRPGIRRLRAC